MLVSLDRTGKVIQSGEGSFNVPMGSDEVDNTLSNPVSQAERLAERNRVEYATMAAASQRRSEKKKADSRRQAYLQNLAHEYEDFVSAESAEENGGENPLLYAAAMQTMAGGAQEQWTPLSGYLLSQDGQLSYDRAMSGNIVRGMGDAWSLIQDAEAQIKSAQGTLAPLVALANGGSPSQVQQAIQAATPASPSSPGAMFQSLMAKQVAGIPVPYLAVGLVGAFFLLRKK